MRLDDIRINVVVIIFIVVLGFAVGLQQFFHKKMVIEPVYQAFASIEGVEGVELKERDGMIVLTLSLADVEHLHTVAAKISSAAARFSQPFQILIKDQPNETLKAAYEQMHFALEQGIATGYFVEMAERIEELALKHKVDFALRIDGSYVYLQLHDGGYYLYQIVSRRDQPLIARLES